jgi:hypothetical protein
MLIDLRKLREPVTVWVRDSLITFSTEYPNTQVSTVGLWGDGFHGTAALHLDTPENSAEHVKEWLKDGPDWYGKDHRGRYCDSCWDFEHFIGDYSFPGYPDLYQTDVGAPVDYINLMGRKNAPKQTKATRECIASSFRFSKWFFSPIYPLLGWRGPLRSESVSK